MVSRSSSYINSTWSPVNTNGAKPCGRWGHKAVIYKVFTMQENEKSQYWNETFTKGNMYVFGGCDKVINFSDLYKFHFGIEIANHHHHHHHPYDYRHLLLLTAHLFVNHLLFCLSFFLSTETNTWIKGNCNGYSRRVFETAVVFKDAMFLYGGKNIHNYSFNELSKFTFGMTCFFPIDGNLPHISYLKKS